MHDGLALIRSGELLYQDDVGRDACGIGGVAAKDGKPSHEVVKKAVLALKNLEHRGGICGDSGDGAGLTCQIPQAFFKEEAKRLKFDQARFLKPEDRLAIGVFFFLDAGPRIDDAKRIIASVMSGGPVHVFGWRPVPVNQAALPERSRESQPGAIEQLLMRAEASSEEVERWLYRRRLELRHRFVEAGLSVYIPSLSNWLVSYKGLLTSFQFADFYPDLSRPEFESGIAIFHRRYSTNTYPNWSLAQPFRYGCHNGEINTVRTNRNAVHAYSRGLKPTLPGNGDLLSPKQSDSGSLDEWVEHLILERNWSLLRDAADRAAGLGFRRRLLGPRCRRYVHALPSCLWQPMRMGWPSRSDRHRWPNADRPSRSDGPAPGALVQRQARLALYRQRIRRFRPGDFNNRCQRSAATRADDRSRYSNGGAPRSPSDHGEGR